MERTYGKDGDDGDRPLRTPATVTTVAATSAAASRHQTVPGQTRAAKLDTAQHLDLKALRLAVHGWWLGSPLVYKPGAADLIAIARELAGAGAASGTLVLSDAPAAGDHPVSGDGGSTPDAKAIHHDSIHAVLILRPLRSRSLLGSATAQAVADMAQTSLGRPCTVRRRWEIVLRDGPSAQRFCRVSVSTYEDVALVNLRLALGRLRAAAGDGVGQPAAALFARPDWREVSLARVLHTLDGRLRAVCVA